MQDKPAYYKATIPNNHRRASWHDYHSRCMYMVTFNKSAAAPLFSDIKLEGKEAVLTLTPFGKIVEEEIIGTPLHNPQVSIIAQVVMPDHVHFIIFVKEPIKKHLGNIVQAIKASATKRIRELCGDKTLLVFAPEFHDRIIYRRGQLDILKKYIRRNPYRLAVRRERPEFFARALNLRIGEAMVRAYGNMFLLRNPFKEQVVVHRRDSEQTKAMQKERWLYAAANGGVLVSPFISKAEKEIRNEAETLGARFILISNETMGERFKPSGRDFELCEQGRLLIISQPHPQLDRAACLAMNRLAEEVCCVADV